MQNVTLTDILLKIKRGNLSDLPATGGDGELLLTKNADDSRSLYVGTGTSVKPLIDDNMRAISAFTVYNNNYDSSYNNKLVYYDETNDVWTLAYVHSNNGKIIKAQGFARFISAGYLSIVTEGKVQVPLFTDVSGNNLVAGNSYYLTNQQSDAGKVSGTLTGIYNQKVFDVLNVDSVNSTCELLINCLSDTTANDPDKWHALKSYLDEGKNLVDTEGYDDVFKCRHSSFNSASISLVGTPIVSLDGILDKLDNSNSLAKSGLLTISSAYRNFEMLISFTTGSDINSNQYIMRLGCTNSSIYDANAIYISGGKLYGQVATVVNSGIDITADTTYYVKLGWISGSSYTVKCSTDGLNWTEQTINYSTALPAGDYYCYFGRVDDVNFNKEFYGQIDLKYANIVINNELFYSCNETGTDTFESNFITVGSPIVSSTGILSGITSGTDYVLTDGALETPQKSLEIYWRGTYYTGSNTLFGTVNAFSCGILNGNTIRLYNANGITTFDCLIGGALSDDDLLNVYVKLTATSVYLEVTTKFGTVNNSATGTYTLNALDVMGIGSTNTGTYPWLGTVDLNGFKVIIDGDSLYQAYLAIPYVKSSSKSKIVNVFYSARLADVYKFYGLAEYYTIDETNQTFALPYGEIYGFMASKENLANKTSILSESEIEYPSCAAVSNALKALNFNTKYAINSGNLDSNGEPDIIATNSTQQQVPYGQPVLTQNGTPGVSELAVAWYYNDTTTSMTTAYNTSASYPEMHPYKMFDGVMDEPSRNTGYVQIRYANQLRLTFLNPVCLTQFKQFNMSNQGEVNHYWGLIKASNDNGSTWTTVHTFGTTAVASDRSLTVTFSSNTNQYSIYEIEMNSDWTEALIPCWPVTEMQLTGTITSGTDGSLIYFNISPSQPLIATDTNNNEITRTSISSLDVSSMANGTYNVLVDEITEDYLKSNLYYQSVAPSSPSTGDIFVNTAIEPLQVQKYSGTVWEEYNKIPIGQFTVSSGAVDASSILTFPFNMNGTVSKLCEDYDNSGNGYHVEWRFDSYTHKFRKYCEQWGVYAVSDTITSGDYVINLSKTYASSVYTREISFTSTTDTADMDVTSCVKTASTSGFTIGLNSTTNASTAIGNIHWKTSGYLN